MLFLAGVPYVISSMPYAFAAWKVANQAYGVYNQYRSLETYIPLISNVSQFMTTAIAGASATSWLISKAGLYISSASQSAYKWKEDFQSSSKSPDDQIHAKASEFTKLSNLEGLKNINIENRHLLYTFVSIIVLFMEYTGIVEIQNYIQRDAKVSQEKSAEKTFSEKLNLTAKEINSEKNKEAPSTLFQQIIHSRYKEETFYRENKGIKGVAKLKNVDPVRIIFNVMIGAMVHANNFIGIQQADNQEKLEKLSHWAQIFLYWEVLAHLLKMHGVAPMYQALKTVANVLKQPTVNSFTDISTTLGLNYKQDKSRRAGFFGRWK